MDLTHSNKRNILKCISQTVSDPDTKGQVDRLGQAKTSPTDRHGSGSLIKQRVCSSDSQRNDLLSSKLGEAKTRELAKHNC